MDYDIWGPWSSLVGPNAPLNDTCTPTPEGSAMSAVKAWTSARFPLQKIILGVAAYGHTYYVNPSVAYDASGMIHPYVPFEPNVVDGEIDFRGLISGGFLTANGTAAKGIDYVFDPCSQTVSHQKARFEISFIKPLTHSPSFTTRTPKSWSPMMMLLHSVCPTDISLRLSNSHTRIAAKGNYIKSAGLAGFSMWETSGDSNDILLDAINSAIDGNQETPIEVFQTQL
jgi:chitinase